MGLNTESEGRELARIVDELRTLATRRAAHDQTKGTAYHLAELVAELDGVAELAIAELDDAQVFDIGPSGDLH
jgi:hypothetical protein